MDTTQRTTRYTAKRIGTELIDWLVTDTNGHRYARTLDRRYAWCVDGKWRPLPAGEMIRAEIEAAIAAAK